MNKTPELEQVFTRGFIEGVEVRAINEEKRTAEFVAATEGGVETWGGKEHLRMSGAKLTRYRKNPVVLDTHDRYSAGSVIGRSDVKVEGKRLIATITFAETARAEEVWTLVRGGFIRALSVGFMPYAGTIKRLAEGESDGDGEDMVTGPARIIRSWELYEISVVPVPADPDCLRRGAGHHLETIAAALAAMGIETRQSGAHGGDLMEEKTVTAPQNGAEHNPETPPPAIQREVQSDIDRNAMIRSLAPGGMNRIADELVLKGASIEDARARFSEELAKATVTVGTPEPPVSQKPAERTAKNIDGRDLADSILG